MVRKVFTNLIKLFYLSPFEDENKLECWTFAGLFQDHFIGLGLSLPKWKRLPCPTLR